MENLVNLSNTWLKNAVQSGYQFNFTWLGRPIIQIPQDIYIVQELIWKVRPDLIIETGIAHGGSLILSASMLALLDYCEYYQKDAPNYYRRKVIGIDVDIRHHNKQAILDHPLNRLIEMIEGSSVCKNIVNRVETIAKKHKRIMVFLDSNHTHSHVLSELKFYAPLVSLDSYCVVWDTSIEDVTDDGIICEKGWGKGNNPKTAVYEFLNSIEGKYFEIDKISDRLLITAANDGFLKRIR